MPNAGPTIVKSETPEQYTHYCSYAGFSEDLQAQGTCLLVIESSFADPGPIWNQFDLYNGGELIASKIRIGIREALAFDSINKTKRLDWDCPPGAEGY